ncbi:halogenase [Dictyobacter sp. S3.2.2.5]|uniref:Halogenase n=1 Tax=Dictyobacter halimunensis TaxID=3026934 RepID=A0ABQ6FNH2_9CHLR|nr:halogenase [Dictyobacter sp. S3.2.2.5]
MSDVFNRVAALPEEKRALLMQHLQKRGPTTEASHDRYDVAILGGGIAGLTLALQLKKSSPAARILVVEKQKHPVPEAAHKVGESTVEIAAHYLRDILGLEEHLQTQQLRKFGLRMFFSASDNEDITRRIELGSTIFPPLCTYQVDRGRLENALGGELTQQGISFLDDCKVQQITLQAASDVHRLRIQRDGEEREIQACWIVDASGRSSLLKRQLKLTKKVEHHANAAWFRVGYPIDIKTWTTDADWQARVTLGDRSLSTNHLMGPGYWVWLIRLASGSTSVGIVTDAGMHNFEEINLLERALHWLHTYEPQCAEEIERQRAAIQDFRVMKDYSYSCEQVFSGERWCLIGEAGVALDPLYSPGSDLIAIANGLTCDLIIRSLKGEDIQGRAQVHDKLFLNLANIWLSIYEHQYSLMDNAQIMVTKIIWDTAFYWGVFGLLYFHDTFRTIVDSPGVAANLSRIAVLSNRIQAFFREWHTIDQPMVNNGFVDLYSPLDFMVKLHTGMAAGLSPSRLEAQFAENVLFFERLAGQIVSTVIETYADHYAQEHVLSQIQRWQTEPYITELIARYRRESRTHPIDSGWIAMKSLRVEKQEVAP